jgi:hypothetical protein
MGLEPVLCQRRHQRTRQQVGGEHREHDRLGERDEQELGDAGEQEHRHEHDADGQGRDQGGQGDLVGAVEDRGLDVLAVLEVPVDVLDRHRGVVDEDADGEREPAERHDVDGLAERRQAGDRGEDRQGDRDRDDEGAAPAAEKQQDQQAGERARDAGLADHAGDGRVHEDRLVAEGADVQVLGQGGPQRRQLLVDPVDDVDRRGIAGLQHVHQDGALAVDPDHVGLGWKAVAHVRHVADVDDAAALGADRHVVQIVDVGRVRVQLDVILERADLLRARRQDQVLCADRGDDVVGRQSVRPQRLRVEIHLHLALFAAVGIGHRGAGDRGQRGAHDEVAGVEDQRLRHRLAGQR